VCARTVASIADRSRRVNAHWDEWFGPARHDKTRFMDHQMGGIVTTQMAFGKEDLAGHTGGEGTIQDGQGEDGGNVPHGDYPGTSVG
jgi:hypothetical protein